MKTKHILEIDIPERYEMTVSEIIDCHSDPLCWFKTDYRLKRRENEFITVQSTKHGKKELLSDGVCVDIETTRVLTDRGYQTYMYIWQVAFGDIILTGRKWNELHTFLQKVQNFYNLGVTKEAKKENVKECLCWIANSGYEFQFICRHVVNDKRIIRNVFSDTMRRPISFDISYTESEKCFKCLDALRIGGINLKTLAKNYCVTQKAVGDLDYSKIRNSKTELSAVELGYCYNDVKILAEWHYFYIETYVKQVKFVPVTSTALIRQAVKQNYKKSKFDDELLMSLHPETILEYVRVVLQLYRGGYTHANIQHVGKIIDNVAGMDFTSSYPAVMLQCKFPMTKFKKMEVSTIYELYEFMEANPDCCWYADITFYDLRNTTYHSVESLHKVHEYINMNSSESRYINHYHAIIDNGRVLSTDQMTVTVTDVDFEVYDKFYTWECVEIRNFRYAEYDYLPVYLTSVIIEMYKRKTVLKRNKQDDTLEYARAKAFVNGIYGLTVQKLHFDEIVYNASGWGHEHKTETGTEKGILSVDEIKSNEFFYEQMYQDMLKRKIKDRYGFIRKYEPKIYLSAYWGVWVTAHARKRILDCIYELGEDALYSDTDSVYFQNPDKHIDYFRRWNESIDKLNKQLFAKDYEELKDLGTFDKVLIHKKSDRYSFISYGAKRYIKYDAEYNIETTIAGLPKNALYEAGRTKKGENATNQEICQWIIDNFDERMSLDFLNSFKQANSYEDAETFCIVTDDSGNSELMHEYSSISIFDIGFSMKVNDMWLILADKIQNDYQERFIYEKNTVY